MGLKLPCDVCDAEVDVPSASDDSVPYGKRVECSSCGAELVVGVHEYEDPSDNIAYLRKI